MAWKDMKLNLKEEYQLSESGLKELQKDLSQIADNLSRIISDAMDKVTTEALVDNLKSAEKIPISVSDNEVVGGIRTTDPIDTFREFGTGIVGSNNPHVAEAIEKVGWIYDVNNHGEKGWWYPTDEEDANPYKKIIDNQLYAWTRGQKAQMKFWNASEKMKKDLIDTIKEEMKS